MNESLLMIERPLEGVAQLILNRPESKNALSKALRTALVTQLTALAADDSVEAVILAGVGEVFCAGFDLKELSEGDTKAIFAEAANYHRVVHRFSKPLIAAIDGPAIAGGMDLALMCDIRFGTEQASFGQPQVRFGIPAAYDLIVSVCDEATARYLCLTGNLIDSNTAMARSILSECFSDRTRMQKEALDCAAMISKSKSGRASKAAFLARQPRLFES
ncbi:MAG: enoyl-CoA hydratase/isomerase family protein [Gammaproteobacteria bacterium]|jgi:enoyl-CoA hydratase/carnithine racemase|nr:enoyl-CoA hydratase/isomerase family protein [Gammaproteobacteria bacterium]MBT5203209.1 enoyl-CoA hydratase/isomerase family protein [Gammaproteobacteria bacterium]MBT5603428.1 enoyl-CoA hydratase/isomerase family protein [Gammaproteobacteria bacterium]MBT6244105.1 enoyl-CoA hydratase/isomerase family protein [Gammaproteobacteria bacterium]